MIVLSRRHARHFGAVLRRCATGTDRARRDPFVVARAGPAGLTLHAVLDEVALRLAVGGAQESAELAFPAAVLAGFAGEADEPVRLEADAAGQGRATFDTGGESREVPFAAVGPDTLPPFPPVPAKFRPADAGLLRALHEATQTAAKERVRFALNRVLLRSRGGLVVATDSKQMLVLAGFTFPWTEDVLIPRVDVWDSPLLAADEPVGLGRTETHVVMRTGPWMIALTIDADGRFPPFEEVLPRPSARATRLHLPPNEVKRLLRELPRLPGRQEDQTPVLLAAGERVTVTGRGAEGRGTLELPEANVEGPAVQAACDRRPLQRALRLGFPVVHIPAQNRPLFCRDEKRTFVWMPDSWEGTEMPAPPPPSHSPVPDSPTPETRLMPLSPTHPRAAVNGDAPPPTEALDPLVEAEELRTLLHAAHGRLGRLLAALKHFRRQSRALQAAVNSLRQLPPLAP